MVIVETDACMAPRPASSVPAVPSPKTLKHREKKAKKRAKARGDAGSNQLVSSASQRPSDPHTGTMSSMELDYFGYLDIAI